jgi:hypothetical protein
VRDQNCVLGWRGHSKASISARGRLTPHLDQTLLVLRPLCIFFFFFIFLNCPSRAKEVGGPDSSPRPRDLKLSETAVSWCHTTTSKSRPPSERDIARVFFACPWIRSSIRSHYKYPLLRSLSTCSQMDPLSSYQSVNPFATFYPPQTAQYDPYATVHRLVAILSLESH